MSHRGKQWPVSFGTRALIGYDPGLGDMPAVEQLWNGGPWTGSLGPSVPSFGRGLMVDPYIFGRASQEWTKSFGSVGGSELALKFSITLNTPLLSSLIGRAWMNWGSETQWTTLTNPSPGFQSGYWAWEWLHPQIYPMVASPVCFPSGGILIAPVPWTSTPPPEWKGWD